jgi:two-component system, chemotaxis family, protein-glutamate methylesterase/glutaminase
MKVEIMMEHRPRRLRVLIVENSAVLRACLQEVFSVLPGMEVVGEAQDGIEALAAIRELQPDVITLDIQMPRMNGLEVLRRIPKDSCQVIMLTAQSDALYLRKCRELNAHHFFDKLTEFQHFVDLMKEM